MVQPVSAGGLLDRGWGLGASYQPRLQLPSLFSQTEIIQTERTTVSGHGEEDYEEKLMQGNVLEEPGFHHTVLLLPLVKTCSRGGRKGKKKKRKGNIGEQLPLSLLRLVLLLNFFHFSLLLVIPGKHQANQLGFSVFRRLETHRDPSDGPKCSSENGFALFNRRSWPL